MLLFAQEGLERMRGPQSTDQTESSANALEKVLRYLAEQLAKEDYAPGLSDVVRLIQFRHDREHHEPVTIRAGWVREWPKK